MMIFHEMVILLSVTFIILLPLLAKNLRFSLYFRQPKSTLQQQVSHENDQRINESKKFLHDSIPHLARNTSIDIMLTIVTVSRNRHQSENYQPQYLTQVTARTLELIHNVPIDKNVKVK